MLYSFKLENEAREELDEILDYIAHTLKNPDAAKNFFSEFSHTIEILKNTPKCAALVKNDTLAKAGVRQIPVNNFCILYIVNDEQTKFSVIHIKYAKSDLNKITLPS